MVSPQPGYEATPMEVLEIVLFPPAYYYLPAFLYCKEHSVSFVQAMKAEDVRGWEQG